MTRLVDRDVGVFRKHRTRLFLICYQNSKFALVKIKKYYFNRFLFSNINGFECRIYIVINKYHFNNVLKGILFRTRIPEND